MIVIDLRGQDRASGAIPGTAHIPAMDLLKEIGTYVEKFQTSRLCIFLPIFGAWLLKWLDAFVAIHQLVYHG